MSRLVGTVGAHRTQQTRGVVSVEPREAVTEADVVAARRRRRVARTHCLVVPLAVRISWALLTCLVLGARLEDGRTESARDTHAPLLHVVRLVSAQGDPEPPVTNHTRRAQLTESVVLPEEGVALAGVRRGTAGHRRGVGGTLDLFLVGTVGVTSTRHARGVELVEARTAHTRGDIRAAHDSLRRRIRWTLHRRRPPRAVRVHRTEHTAVLQPVVPRDTHAGVDLVRACRSTREDGTGHGQVLAGTVEVLQTRRAH